MKRIGGLSNFLNWQASQELLSDQSSANGIEFSGYFYHAFGKSHPQKIRSYKSKKLVDGTIAIQELLNLHADNRYI